MKRKTVWRALGRVSLIAMAAFAICGFAAPMHADAAEVSDQQSFLDAVEAGGEVSIGQGASIELTEPVTVDKNVALTGSGTIKLADGFQKGDSKAPITVESGATLAIDGVTLDGGSESHGYGNRAGGMVYVAGTLDLESGTVQNVKSSKVDGDYFGVVYVADGGSFAMNGGTLKDNELWGTPYDSKGAVHVAPGASFTLNDGSLTNNIAAGAYGLSGVVFVSEDGSNAPGTFTMNGGSISDNKSTAVKVGGNGRGTPAVFTMKGGVISDNTITQTGDDDVDGPTKSGSNIFSSAVYVGFGAFTMEGGTISGNTSAFWGGGVVIAAGNAGASFHMTGGTIEGNTAGCGGGVFVTHAGSASPDVRLSGGKIINNTATQQGGGVYVVNGDTVHLENVVVTDNTATMLGGGIWTCATGSVKTYITNGGAVFGNTANGDTVKGSAGDDLAFVNHKVAGGEADFSVSERMVGGGKVNYYADGAIVAGDKENSDGMGLSYLGEYDKVTPRYDASNPGKAITTDDLNVTDNNYALKSDVSDGAAQAATKAAKLVISGNKANRGAGIGANGNVVIGVAPTPETPEYTLNVNKVWAEGTLDTQKVPVEVALVSDGVQLDTVTLSEGNGWKASFTGLPEGDYTVVEVNTPAGFTAEVSKTIRDKDTSDYSVTVTNTYSAAPVTAHVSAKKVLEGAKLAEGQFSFELVDESGEVISTAKNAADGTVTFDDITYDSVGEYAYTVREVLPEDDNAKAKGTQKDNVTYDASTHKVVVKVTDDLKGHLVAEVQGDGPTFKNTYAEPGKPAKPGKPEGGKDDGSALPQTGDGSLPAAALAAMATAGAVLVGGGVALTKRRAR